MNFAAGQYTIIDDSGFLAIIDPYKYNSFVDEDWSFLELKERFVSEMQKNSLIIWSTGMEGTWNVQILTKPLVEKSFRQFEKAIRVTNKRLVLTNYEYLTEAAQFKDFDFAVNYDRELCIEIENGLYLALIRQLADTEDLNEALTDGQIQYEIILSPIAESDGVKEDIKDIIWLES
jgi:hypothetical protein